MAAAHPLKIDFEAENLPDKLPDDISLCLFRVAQESLRNTIKHSGATSVQVSIKFKNGGISLSVTDNGSGFDTTTARVKESLGLTSIDERVRAVKGEARINSTVGFGTKVEVSVPVKLQVQEY